MSTSGIGTGLNIKELVSNLVEAEGKAKKIKYDKDEAIATAKITGYGTIKSALSQFEDTLTSWQYTNPFQNRNASATTFNGNPVINATASSGSRVGNYSIEVTQLAMSQKSGSVAFDESYTVVGTGTLTFTMGAAVHSFDITSSNNTVEQIANTINAVSGSTGISANLISSDTGVTIVFSANNTGLNNVFTVSVTDDSDGNDTDASGLSRLASNNLTVLQAAQNSNLKIEGVPVVSDSNTITDSIKGVELDLLLVNTHSPITLTVSDDVDGAIQSIQDFVDSYNQVFDTINTLTEANIDVKDKSGVLIGDSTLRSIQFQMRRVINSLHALMPAGFSSLSQIGITTDQYTGKLKIDDTQLKSALHDNYDAVGSLFMDPKEGLVNNMDSFLQDYVEVGGILQSRVDGLQDGIEVINEQRVVLERHLIQLQSRLLSQFIAMDTTVARLRSVSDYLATQLENLPKPQSSRK